MKVPIKIKPLIDALKATYGEEKIIIEKEKDTEGEYLLITLCLELNEDDKFTELRFTTGGRPFIYSYFGLRNYID